MKRKSKKKGTKSIIVLLYAIMLVVLVSIFGILLINNKYTKELAYECLTDKTELYTKFIEREIVSINQELQMIRMNNQETLKKIPFKASAKDGEYYPLWNELMKINHNKEAMYDYKGSFLEYGYNADVLILKDGLYFSDTSRTDYVNKIVKQLRFNCENSIETIVWNYISDGETDYLLGSVQTEGKAVGCILKIDDLIGDFEVTSLGYEGFLIFEKKGIFYSSTSAKKRKEIKEILPEIKESESEHTDKYAWYTYYLNGVGNIKIVTLLSNGILDVVNILQIFLSLAFILIVVIVIYMIWYLYKRVLNPMRKFVVQLQNPEIDTYLNEKNGEGPLELALASEKFKQVYRELQSLRIDLYEKELFEKNTMLEYAQEQMKPHFFLNCMSVVQSMAELHHEQDIVYILDVLSRYMRYVLKDTFEMRHIGDELKHLKDYMEIQALSKPGMFKYEAIVEDNLEDHEILPLVLQTIVENSVKHGLKVNECIEISVYVTSMDIEDNKYLYIVISDTGNGFPQDVLDKIKNEEPIIYNGCEHIGIRNTIKRIKMKYGDKATITFGNMRENYGAVVEITLPFE